MVNSRLGTGDDRRNGDLNDEFAKIKSDVTDGRKVVMTVRDLLGLFEARRRRSGVVKRIRTELKDAGIVTNPDFTKVWIDAKIEFKKTSDADCIDSATEDGQTGTVSTDSTKDSNFLISRLKAAVGGVISVNPQDTIQKAITLMLARDFSQLAVMSNERTLKGAISWKTIGKRLSHKHKLIEVKDAMEIAESIEDSETLFKATRQIIDHEYIFVRSPKSQKITGIVTATDLSEQFQSLSEPFLLMAQIENKIRNLLDGKFEVDKFRDACNPSDPDRKDRIESVADLTFGEYIRIIEEPENWTELDLSIDQKVFCGEMNMVREIRNDVMHFDPDGIDEEQYRQLRQFSRLMDELDSLAQ